MLFTIRHDFSYLCFALIAVLIYSCYKEIVNIVHYPDALLHDDYLGWCILKNETVFAIIIKQVVLRPYIWSIVYNNAGKSGWLLVINPKAHIIAGKLALFDFYEKQC
jgi:hypothetical protein